ncbi:ABC transporter permease [Kaistia dalseonensis]|uniref:ABC-2 type transport system permease protein n=1 Tax=Kaistia dalseonensis TaxID=410840 RepID=A0ABU0H839_9HYPH|nr:ABC transporter permease [Kaistia dalseonensis]MCX5495873.1 ABC transporter permease [Kaistia dalseonensis]MDQ0438474.1 ABC-2 type transport system permease protein [Kaistia dalseonensis]
MFRSLGKIFHLGVKELRSLRADWVLAALIVYTFTIAVYTVSTGAKFEVQNASVGVVDEDRSPLSFRIRDAFLTPFFKPAQLIEADEIDSAMDSGRFVFVIEIPPKFEQDTLAGKKPSVQINIDATAMSQAGNGAAYIQSIILQEVAAALPSTAATTPPIAVVTRAKFNPNLNSSWFTAVMQVINNVTLLSIILTGAALLRERERGTIEHLLVMPVTPVEIMLAKIWANGLVILVAAVLSLIFVVQGLLGVPISGSIALFVFSAMLYQFSVTALGILIATFATSMAQFGLIAIPVLVILMLLSGSTTPLESMPQSLQYVMQFMPTPHFVSLSQAILYRGSSIDIIWPQLLALVAIGAAFFTIAAIRFRKTISSFH